MNANPREVSFVGLVIHQGAPVSRRDEELLVRALGRGSRNVQIQRCEQAVFVQTGLRVAHRGAPFVVSSRLDDRPRISEQAGGENEYIRGQFEARGDAGIAELLGAFAFAHWDESSRTLTLARDCLGERALFFHVGPGFVAFASHLATLLALPDVPRELDERLLANFLALNHREREATFYRGICRVPSRTVVRITDKVVVQRHYWSPDFEAQSPRLTEGDYIARARELFDRATARTLRDTPRVAIRLSGGLDSSAIAATAARLGDCEIACYTGVSPVDLQPRPGWYLDERGKVEALARLYPTLNMNFIEPRGAHRRQSDPTRFFADVPFANRNVANLGWFAQIDDALAAHGHRIAFNGGLGNMTLSWDGRFSLAAQLQQGRLLSLLTDARAIARNTKTSFPRVLAGEAVMPLLPPFLQRAVGRMRGVAEEDVSPFSLLRRDVVADLDLRRQWREDGFDPLYRSRGSSARLRAHQIFDQAQYSRDIVAMRSAADGIEWRSAYNDRELIEFSLSVPETLFRRKGISRWFARQIFADRLPPEILAETKRGAQAPNWFESLDARKPIIVEEVARLESSRMASRLIDLERLKRLVAEWPRDAREAQARELEYRLALDRAVHVGQFIRWVEGGNG